MPQSLSPRLHLKKRVAFVFILCFISLIGCKFKKENIGIPEAEEKTAIQYAKGFTIKKSGDITTITVSSPWPESENTFTYALIPKKKPTVIRIDKNVYDAIIPIPIENLVVTSTTHIPALEALSTLDKLIGFPETKFVSSKTAREKIKTGQIKELGSNESINTELLLELQPDVVVGFSIDNQNSVYKTIQRAGIPVIYNGDWTEQTPLGKAEWIKFFGAILNKEKEADSIFNTIAENYNSAKKLALSSKNKPSVLSGALYKDVWYLPAGKSWAAQFISDANANYLWSDMESTGSLSLGIESILEKGSEADFWVAPSQFTSYAEMENATNHYLQFNAFKNKKVFTYAAKKGETGGLLYYELAPQRPDWVLKDLIYIFHPELIPDYEPHFFTPLK